MNIKLPRNLYLLSLTTIFLYCCPGAIAQNTSLKNVAIGKRYTLSPRPNYPLCSDENDRVQLTDGKYSQDRLWKQKGTVGWQSVRYAEIMIDLEAPTLIAGIALHTAAGIANVKWPKQIYLLVGDHQEEMYYVGDLVQLSGQSSTPPLDRYSRRFFRYDSLAAKGRFVKLIIRPDGRFAFTDEIEIYQVGDDHVIKPAAGQKVQNVAGFLNIIDTKRLIQRRLLMDLAEVRATAQRLQQNERFISELALIEEEIADIAGTADPDFRTTFPLNAVHKKIFAVQAAIWRAAGWDSIVVWQKHRWDMVSPTEPLRAAEAIVEIIMMQNEFRNAAFNISNCSALPVDLKLDILDLPDGMNPNYISIYDIPFTDTIKGVPIMAAMPNAEFIDHHYQFHIDPGLTRQVWLTFHSRNLAPGTYEGRVVIEPGHIQIPIYLKVYPFIFPEKPTLHLGGWDYTDRDFKYDVTKQNRVQLIEQLRDHFVDSPWATSRVMPFGRYDDNGNMIAPPDASYFIDWIGRWPGIDRYFVFLNVSRRFSQFEAGTPIFKIALANWTSWWVDKLACWNIKPEQLHLQLVDEPRSAEEDRLFIEYSRVIKAVQPKINIWVNPITRDPRTIDGELFRWCDILCAKTSDWIAQGRPFADFYADQRRLGKELWLYSCNASTKLLDPYTYYLMQHWLCWKFGAAGSAFWAFGDSNGASSWNEYISQTGAFTPLFIDLNSVNTGKHMEAIREGIEDFEYLKMLQERVIELEKRPFENDALTTAKDLLHAGVIRVIDCLTDAEKIQWQTRKDRGAADDVRAQILQTLLELKDL